MELGALLDPDSRVIDVGPQSAALARELAGQGHHRYLGLVDPQRLDAVRADAGPLADRFHPLRSASQALHCSTDALVVRTRYRDLVWALRDLQHLRHLAIESGPAEGVTALAAARARLSGTTRRIGVAEGAVRAQVLELPARRRQRPRSYLSPVVGIPGLAARLAERSVRYAVLRWFDDLPHVAPDEDLDILVADDDLATLRAVLDDEPGIIPVDVYSESGTGGADFRTAAYYPPPLARGLLERAVVHPSGFRVPAPPDHLRSLAYHAAYHKGRASGVPSAGSRPVAAAVDHDYVGTLAGLGRELAEPVGTTLEEVDAYLGTVGWRPPADTLRRLAPANPWLAEHLHTGPKVSNEPPLVSVFVVRERTATVVTLDEVERVLTHHGFEVLAVRTLDGAARDRCAAHMRGGNWGPGPFPVSGGVPVAVAVAAHYAPVPPSADDLLSYPRLENHATLRAKNAVRDLVASRVAEGDRFNPMHSSDDELEAWEYVRLALPGEEGALRAAIETRRARWRPGDDVVRSLSRSRRSKVEVVVHGGTLRVRKTYAPGFRRFLEREIEGRDILGPRIEAVLPVLDRGEDWFVTELVDDTLPSLGERGLLPLHVVRAMVDVLRRVHEEGFDLVDAKPENFVVDAKRGPMLIDMEFLHRYDGQVPPFARSYGFVPPPAGCLIDVPAGNRSYERRWLPRTGLPLDVLVAAGPGRQHLYRAGYRLSRATVAPGAPPRAAVRRVTAVARRASRRLRTAFARWSRRRAQLAVG